MFHTKGLLRAWFFLTAGLFLVIGSPKASAQIILPGSPTKVANPVLVAEDDRQIAVDKAELAAAKKSGDKERIQKARSKLQTDMMKRNQDAGISHKTPTWKPKK